MIMKPSIPADLNRLSWLSRLLDSQFRVPGTNFRFGIDPLIGLIPGAGDFITFLISSMMLTTLARNGASGHVLARMVLNVVLDTLIGAIPLAGDLFDFAFKSNQRNLRLLQEHYTEGRHRGGAWKVIVPVLLLLLLCMTGIVWLVYKIGSWLF
jgi:NAD/NADP transhydrogenase beta subunit